MLSSRDDMLEHIGETADEIKSIMRQISQSNDQNTTLYLVSTLIRTQNQYEHSCKTLLHEYAYVPDYK